MYFESKKRSSGSGAQLLAYALVLGIYAIVAETGGCSVNAERFRAATANEGLEGAVQGRYDWFECGYMDWWNSSLDAKRGERNVTGTMCCGIFKGCTVRWQ